MAVKPRTGLLRVVLGIVAGAAMWAAYDGCARVDSSMPPVELSLGVVTLCLLGLIVLRPLSFTAFDDGMVVSRMKGSGRWIPWRCLTSVYIEKFEADEDSVYVPVFVLDGGEQLRPHPAFYTRALEELVTLARVKAAGEHIDGCLASQWRQERLRRGGSGVFGTPRVLRGLRTLRRRWRGAGT